MERRISRRIFIVGCPRSGTTLLQSLLSAHPWVASFPETHAFAQMVPRRTVPRLLGLTRPAGREALARTFQELGAGRHPLGLGTLFYRLAAKRLIDLLDRAALVRGFEAWVEKTPRHLHYMVAIRRAVPHACFVHMVRRGEDVVASLYAVSRQAPQAWGPPKALDECIDRWLLDVGVTAAHLGSPGHDLVVYEHLVRDPESVLRLLCAALDLPYDHGMILGYRREAARLVRPEESWKQEAVSPIRSPSSGKFERLFSAAEQRYVRERLLPGQRLLESRLGERPAASTVR